MQNEYWQKNIANVTHSKTLYMYVQEKKPSMKGKIDPKKCKPLSFSPAVNFYACGYCFDLMLCKKIVPICQKIIIREYQ